MILTSSRMTATKCWRKTFNTYHRNLAGPKATPLVDGGATHAGIAMGLATKDWAAAKQAANAQFNKDIQHSDIPPEQAYLVEDHRDLVTAILQCFEENIANEPYEVVQPECMINVPIPGTEHNDITLHWYDPVTETDHWGMPPAEKILRKEVRSPHPSNTANRCPCWQPHRIVGQTDALVLWERNLWLLEHKTTSILGEQFWSGFELDLQPSLYLYGIWKQLGIQPRGVIVNALYKPSDKQVSAWNEKRKTGPSKAVKDYIRYERQPILRCTEDLERIAQVAASVGDEWEWRILRGDFRPALMKTICIEFNRQCEFHTCCTSHESAGSFDEFQPREQRYDDALIKELVQITKP